MASGSNQWRGGDRNNFSVKVVSVPHWARYSTYFISNKYAFRPKCSARISCLKFQNIVGHANFMIILTYLLIPSSCNIEVNRYLIEIQKNKKNLRH